MCNSLRTTLNALGIYGFECERLIKEYLGLVAVKPDVTMNAFIRAVKENRK